MPISFKIHLFTGLKNATTFRCIFLVDPWFAGSSNVGINKWRLVPYFLNSCILFSSSHIVVSLQYNVTLRLLYFHYLFLILYIREVSKKKRMKFKWTLICTWSIKYFTMIYSVKFKNVFFFMSTIFVWM